MPGQVTITSVNPNLRVVALLDQNGGRVTGGYGGWTVVSRPRRQGFTQWDGREPFTLELGIILDGWADDEPVDGLYSNLERMAMPPREYADPPIVRVSGPVPHSDLTWVIQEIAWGEDVLRNERGQLLRQPAVLTLIRYMASDVIQVKPAAQRARQRASGQTGTTRTPVQKSYVVRSGDTLSGIAAKFYHDASKWKRIADANGIRDPKSIKVGQRLSIP